MHRDKFKLAHTGGQMLAKADEVNQVTMEFTYPVGEGAERKELWAKAGRDMWHLIKAYTISYEEA